MERVNSAIFRAYDIRGVVPDDIDAEIAEYIGRAVVIHTRARTVAVGRDMRSSSPELAEAVLRGVTQQGADAVDIGLTSTPIFNFAVADTAGHDAGIMVTASHNPAKYNGFKMDYGNALPVSAATGMDEIKRLAEGRVFPASDKTGTVTKASFLEAYLDKVTALVDPATLKPFRMVIDCGNGMGGYVMLRLAPRMRGEVKPLFWELDGTFPNHEPNPIKPENVRALAAAVREEGAAVGFAYDGDADRLGVVDECGELVRGDLLSTLLAREILRLHPGAVVLYDLRASRAVAEEISAAGGRPVPTRVGHALIKKHLRDVGAVFAGELSNHFYFKDFYGAESTELAMLMLLKIMSETGGSLSEMVVPLQRYHHSGEVNFEAADKEAVLRELEARYAPQARAVLKLDGLSVDLGPWWFNVRPSNTEPLLRLVVETLTQRETEERVEEIGKVIAGKT